MFHLSGNECLGTFISDNLPRWIYMRLLVLLCVGMIPFLSKGHVLYVSMEHHVSMYRVTLFLASSKTRSRTWFCWKYRDDFDGYFFFTLLARTLLAVSRLMSLETSTCGASVPAIEGLFIFTVPQSNLESRVSMKRENVPVSLKIEKVVVAFWRNLLHPQNGE